MRALLIRIAEGVVVGGRSKVHYPESFPTVLRGVIEGCLEREPAGRWPSVTAVITELRGLLRARLVRASLADRDRRERTDGKSFEHLRELVTDDRVAVRDRTELGSEASELAAIVARELDVPAFG